MLTALLGNSKIRNSLEHDIRRQGVGSFPKSLRRHTSLAYVGVACVITFYPVPHLVATACLSISLVTLAQVSSPHARVTVEIYLCKLRFVASGVFFGGSGLLLVQDLVCRRYIWL